MLEWSSEQLALDVLIAILLGWQVISNQEAVDLVKPIKDPQAAAKRLTSEALRRESKDDISCIVIRFANAVEKHPDRATRSL